MQVPDAVSNQFEEWMDEYKAELREGMYKRFRLTDGINGEEKSTDVLQNEDQVKVP
jgi:hypothetical protein